MPTLRIHLPDKSEVTHELIGDRITIGRRPDNTIQIIDRSVSAYHAEFIFVEGHYRLHDLQSTNLTFVEGSGVTDYHLLAKCNLSFGTVQCDFDPNADLDHRLSPAQMEKDVAFLRADNAELQAKLEGLERRIDILNSARLVTGRTENSPNAANNDSLRAITVERDDLRHQNTGLKLELEKVKEELAITSRERDAARQKNELMHADRVAIDHELAEFRAVRAKNGTDRIDVPATPLNGASTTGAPANGGSIAASSASTTTSAAHSHVSFAEAYSAIAESATTQKIIVLPPAWQAVPALLTPMREILAHLKTEDSDSDALVELAGLSRQLAEAVTAQREHPVGRLITWMDALLQNRFAYCLPPFPATIETLDRAATLLARVLEPRLLERARLFPSPSVLAIDDDPDLLATLLTAFGSAHFEAAEASEAEQGCEIARNRKFDLILLDHQLGGADAQTLAAQIRDTAPCGKTPIIFLTEANGAENGNASRFAGGSDFLAKPFHTAELIVKGQTWSLQSQFGML